jgi:hypothetical protein
VQTGKSWTEFGDNQDAWAAKFTDAWNRFAVVGNDVGSLADCSHLIGSGVAKKRSAMSMPMGARAYARYRS